MTNSSRFKLKDHALRAVAVLGELLYRRGYRGLSLLQWDEPDSESRTNTPCNYRSLTRAQNSQGDDHD